MHNNRMNANKRYRVNFMSFLLVDEIKDMNEHHKMLNGDIDYVISKIRFNDDGVAFFGYAMIYESSEIIMSDMLYIIESRERELRQSGLSIHTEEFSGFFRSGKKVYVWNKEKTERENKKYDMLLLIFLFFSILISSFFYFIF